MSIFRYIIPCLALACLGCASPVAVEQEDGMLTLSFEGKDVLSYQYLPMTNPQGGEKFHGSNFIHPLKTP